MKSHCEIGQPESRRRGGPLLPRRAFAAGLVLGGGLWVAQWLPAEKPPVAPLKLPTAAELRQRPPQWWQLVDVLNVYRRAQGLPAVALSPKLCAVAAFHVRDLEENRPHERFGSMHSWSPDQPRWNGGIFAAADKTTYPIMWNKPKEIAGYPALGYEVVASGTRSLAHALEVWKQSPTHHDVIVNRGIWARMAWKAVGAAWYKGFASAWFGEAADA